MRRLVLFDIDGTLLHGGRLFRECFEGAMRSIFQGRSFPRISFSGKTDRQICRELMTAAGLWPERGGPDSEPEPELEACIDSVIGDYLARVREAVPRRGSEVKLLPGVVAVLDALGELGARNELALGLLTGNVSEGARMKLSAVGLEDRFAFGAFGDDHWDRYRLPAVAVARARERVGIEFRGKQIVVIGDTIHDVNCGRSLGVRAIGVGTGQAEQRVQVREAGPDYFFEDLSDTEAVVRAILEEKD